MNSNYQLSKQKARPYELRVEIVALTIESQITYQWMLHKNTFPHTVTLSHLQRDSECCELPNLRYAFILVHIHLPYLFETFSARSTGIKSLHLPQF
jgi:hypothetical protein